MVAVEAKSRPSELFSPMTSADESVEHRILYPEKYWVSPAQKELCNLQELRGEIPLQLDEKINSSLPHMSPIGDAMSREVLLKYKNTRQTTELSSAAMKLILLIERSREKSPSVYEKQYAQNLIDLLDLQRQILKSAGF